MDQNETNESNVSEFDDWCTSIETAFKDLNLERKLILFERLFNVTSGEERYFLVDHTVKYFCHDLFVCLPIELQEYICHFIDVKSLLLACQVSKKWNVIISSLHNVWKKKSSLTTQKNEVNGTWKTRCIHALVILDNIRNGTLFHQYDLSARELFPGQVIGLDYSNGNLTAGGHNMIGIWRMEDYELITAFGVSSTVSCIQYHDCKIIVGHCTGVITVWNFKKSSEINSPYLVKSLRSHTGVITSLSVGTAVNILASGATDSSVKLWCLLSGTLLTTLLNHRQWIIQVSLVPKYSVDSTTGSGHYSLLTVSEKCICLSTLNVTLENRVSINVAEEQCVHFLLTYDFGTFIPGCHIVNDNIIYLKCKNVENEDEIGTEIHLQNVTQSSSVKCIIPYRVRKLLAAGEKLALLLLHTEHCYKNNLIIVELQSGREVGGCYVPLCSSSSPNLSQIAVGETEWLDDICLVRANTMIVALGLANGLIHIVTWREMSRNLGGFV